MVHMKVQTLGKRSTAILAALALAVGGNVVAAHAAAPTYIDCQLFAAGEPDHIDPAAGPLIPMSSHL